MILATHALTGAVIGKYINNTWLVIILSVILHFVLDTFRHGEYLNQKSAVRETFGKVAIDILIGIVVVLLIANLENYSAYVIKNILIGAFFSMFPDSLTFLYWKGGLKFLKKPFNFHTWTHPYPPFSPEREWNSRNAVNDIAILIIAIALLLF